MNTRITRRRFSVTAGYALASVALGQRWVSTNAADGDDARLTARPQAGAASSLKSGPLGLSRERDGVIQLPSRMPDGKVPLLVFLHGASGNGAGQLRRIGPAADEAGVAVLAPDSRNGTWDAIRNGFGEDVVFLNRALEFVFERLAVDPARLAIGGFFDGASYALSLGLINGSLFPRVVACSPGFVVSGSPTGRPQFFISHGTSDQILPIDRCSRVIVPRLRALGYNVTFREFGGRHELPPAIATEGMRWMTA